jgi:integrase
MSWEGSPNFRWVKMYRGVRYRVTCHELGATAFTKETTMGLANQWWLKKRAEIDGPTAERAILIEDVEAGLHLRELAERGEAARRIIDSLMPEPRTATEEEVRRTSEAIIGQGSIDDEGRRTELLAVVRAQVDPSVAAATGRSVKANGECFLAVVKGDMKPRSFQELKDYIHSLYQVPGLLTGDTDVKVIDEALVEKVYLALRDSSLSGGAKKKRWGFFRRFVKYLWEKRLIEMPRNLSSHRFEVKARKIKTHSPAEVKRVLAALKSRLKLYALLGLNCGMTNVDISQLTKEMVDLDRGRLVRRRVKTGEHANVPTVDYKLWPETLELLKHHQSCHPELFLTSMSGTPLWECRFEGEEVRRKDMIVQQWRRAKVALPLKAFRSIAATILESHEAYGRYVAHFLGHSPKSMADKHYAAPSQELFDKIMGWLHEQLFGA